MTSADARFWPMLNTNDNQTGFKIGGKEGMFVGFFVTFLVPVMVQSGKILVSGNDGVHRWVLLVNFSFTCLHPDIPLFKCYEKIPNHCYRLLLSVQNRMD